MRPLEGIKVIEMAGKATSPYCGMLLADFGADIVIVDRVLKEGPKSRYLVSQNPMDRGKRSMRVNLKSQGGLEIVHRLIQGADVLMESYRPGVMESLGLGPEKVLKINPRVIFARMTGWGQDGPYANTAGHDINYLAMSGALSLFKRKGEKPLPPCNVLGDFAGGGLLGAMGILLSIIERNKSGKGQVVDAAMLDGVAHMATVFFGMWANKLMSLDIGTNLLDGGAPHYQVYETSDGKFVAVGAIEGKFYSQLIKGMGLEPSSLPNKGDPKNWPEMTVRFAEIFKTKTRDEWTGIFENKDACVHPVLELDEVSEDTHIRERGVMIDIDGMVQPAPAPRLSRTPGYADRASGMRGAGTRDILAEFGYSQQEIEVFFQKGLVQ
ncbi:CaiB/BaiF CoA transferase family protein [Thermodesulfobacteriota bacterium]